MARKTFYLILSVFLVITTCASAQDYYDVRCGTRPVYPEEADRVRLQTQDILKYRSNGPTLNGTVNVYFHVIRKDKTKAGGNIPSQWITDQMTILNNAYPNITFNLVSTDRTTKATWFRGENERQMKTALRKGNCSDLNIYTTKFTDPDLLGEATYPWDCNGDMVMDGVRLLFKTLPGSSYDPYNLGDTGTHEVGHWASLYHTFEGGCFGPGDECTDTEEEAVEHTVCVDSNSCFEDPPEYDPIHNFMDYTDDACMYEFTADQVTRMNTYMGAYR